MVPRAAEAILVGNCSFSGRPSGWFADCAVSALETWKLPDCTT